MVAAIAIGATAAAALVLWSLSDRHQAQPPTAPEDPPCISWVGTGAAPHQIPPGTASSQPYPVTADPQQITLAPIDRRARWHYRVVETVQAEFSILTSMHEADRIDERLARWRPATEAEPQLQRQVVIGEVAWNDNLTLIDDRGTPTVAWNQWSRCIPPYRASPKFWLALGHPEPGETCRNRCTLLAKPGSLLHVRNGRAVEVDGEPMTTFDVIGYWHDLLEAAGTPARASITIDTHNRLRRGTTWDAITGTVYAQVWADPAPPGHPPITDPTNEPVFSAAPPPPRPEPLHVDPATGNPLNPSPAETG
jgi:hypothetical protein